MAKPKLALIPAAQGDKFYSVLPSDGVGDFDFTRNSSATRIAPTGFIQEVGAFGSELVVNGDFATDSDWLKATGWSISGGKAVATAANNGADLVQNIGLVNGKSYKIEVTISGYVAGSLRINFLGTGGNFGDFTANGTYIGYADGGSDSRLQITATTTTTTLSVDNVSVIEVIGNKSRLNYDLLNGKVVNCPHYLLEPARTNLATYSETFSNAYWTKEKTSITSNAVISPDGTLNASKLVEDSSAGLHRTYSNLITTAQNNDYTSSVFAKKGGRNIFGIQTSSGAQPYVWFNLDKGIIELQQSNIVGKIESLPNGWYKCSATWNSSSTTNDRVFLQLAKSTSNTSYTGDGTSGIYLWGAQFEQGSYPTSYIPTTGTAVTRAAETATGSGDAATFNDSEGVLMAEIAALADDDVNRFITISDGSTSNRVALRIDTDNKIGGFVTDGTSQASFRYEMNTLNFTRVAIKYKVNDFALWVNGFEVLTDFVGSTPSGLNVFDFKNSDNINPFYGKTRELQYFDSALTDAQLETLTSWTSLQEMITSQLYTNY